MVRIPLSCWPRNLRRGFTLVELMIVVIVILAVALMTILAVNFSNSNDRIKAGARQMQSFFAGARDRAIYAKEQRGVRLILDPANSHTAIAMQYVGAPERYSDGSITFDPTITSDTTGTVVAGVSTNWTNLQNNGFFGIGSRIEIPKKSGNYFTVISSVNSVTIGGVNYELVTLNQPQRNYAGNAATGSTVSYGLVLPPSPLMGSEPSQLPVGVVIDLDGSLVPSSWRPSSLDSTQSYGGFLDIMYTPRGLLTGDAASIGLTHLLLADVGDVEQWRNVLGRVVKASPTTTEWSPPIVPANDTTVTPKPLVRRDQAIVTINGRTGNVSVHSVDPTNANNDQVADDPYRFAETGEVANQ